MLLPVESSILPIYPMRIDPSPRLVKSTGYLSHFSYIVLSVQALTALAFLVSSAPLLAFPNILAMVLGFFAVKSCIPVQLLVHAAISAFVCLLTVVRLSVRIEAPQFGYSQDQHALSLALALQELASQFKNVPSPNVFISIPLMANPHSETAYFRKINTSKSLDDEKHMDKGTTELALRGPKLFPYTVSLMEPVLLNTGTLENSNTADRVLPTPANMTSRSSAGASHQLTPHTRGAVTVDSPISQAPNVINGTHLVPMKQNARLNVIFSPRELYEYIEYVPSLWRIRIEQVSLVVFSICTCLSAILSLRLRARVEKFIIANVQETLNGQHSSNLSPGTAPTSATEETAGLLAYPSQPVYDFSLGVRVDNNGSNRLSTAPESVSAGVPPAFVSFTGEGVPMLHVTQIPEDREQTANQVT